MCSCFQCFSCLLSCFFYVFDTTSCPPDLPTIMVLCFFPALAIAFSCFFNVFSICVLVNPAFRIHVFNVFWPLRFRDFHVFAAAAEIIVEQAVSQEGGKLSQQRAEGGHSLLNKPRAKAMTGRANSSARREGIHF